MTVIWTGAILGEVGLHEAPPRPRGGLARIASAVARERRGEPDLLFFDLGDFAGDPVPRDPHADGAVVRRERARVVLEALGAMGASAVVPGERDLSLGASRLARWAAEAGVPLLTSNVVLGGDGASLGLEETWATTPAGEVAFLSLTAPLTEPEAVGAAEGHARALSVLDPPTALRRALGRVRPRAAFVVLLAHGPTPWAAEVLEEVSGVDLCIVAHDGDGPPTGPTIVGSSYLLTTGAHGTHIGRVRITLAPGSPAGLSGAAIEVVRDLAGDPGIEALVDRLPARLSEAQARLEGASDQSAPPGGGSFLGFAACGTCHSRQADSWLSSPHPGAFHQLQRTLWHVEPACFPCHTTGFGFFGGFTTRELTPAMAGVGCEACHGPGDELGHSAPGFGRTDEATCRRCHDEIASPGFDYESAYARVRHDVPGPVLP